MTWRALQPGGFLHPGVAWPRFAAAGFLGLVFLCGIVATSLLVPASTPWFTAAGAVGIVWRAVARRRQERFGAAAAERAIDGCRNEAGWAPAPPGTGPHVR
jgi:hypothetical protein